MHHVFVIETAHHMHNGIGLADVGKKLIAQAFAFGCARHQAGDIHKLHDGRKQFLRLRNIRELGETRIRHFDNADVGLDGAEGIILCSDARLGQRIEQGGFADVGQADDAAF